ncbi:MAG: glycerol kinase GlpK [Saccharofermentanales bacterium]
MPKKYILTLDQGTTSSRAIVFDRKAKIVSKGKIEFKQYYPQPGWVEHDPEVIWSSQKKAMDEALSAIDINDIAAIAITNQRETTILWDRITGEPVHPAIVWQCRRSASICDDLKKRGLEDYIRKTTGLPIDAYFSATKIKWIFDRFPEIKQKARSGEICFGTVDSWLLWKLTGGRIHATDYTNASRTMLFDINKFRWDEVLLDELDIPPSILPEVKDTSGFFGNAVIDGVSIPVMAMAGDQQAALFGQTCFEEGDVKNTYGTGCFILCNTGPVKIESEAGLLSTIAWRYADKTTYALEGSVFNAGSAIQWLRDEMKLIKCAEESDIEAAKVPDSGGVYFVPAFTGLGAPYWDMYARGTMVGITRGTSRQHFIRAVLDSISYQSRDIIEAMSKDGGMRIKSISADGGAAASDVIMQFQADILGVPVKRPKNIESTALGAAFLAGIQIGFWSGKDELRGICVEDRIFLPQIPANVREDLYRKWRKAVKCSMGWEAD